MTCPPHHRIVTGHGDKMIGRCKKCGDERSYAWTLEETTFQRWRFRKDRKSPPVSAMGGIV